MRIDSRSLLVLASATFLWAQTPGAPAPSNIAGAQYPRINPDRSVTFRIRAANATKVSVGSGFGLPNTDLTKGEDGFWAGTTKPLDPGFYYYSVNIDGTSMKDPGSQAFFGSNNWGSAVEVPGPDSDFFAAKDVPHGAVRQQWYFSKSTHQWRDVFIYTPPNYDQKTSARYPVLYLQHGAGENNTSWSNQGHENFILDNLIAAGKTKPMIIVNESGTVGGGTFGGAPAAGPGGGRGAPAGDGGRGAGGRGRGGFGATVMLESDFSAFEEIVVHELIPYIDSSFRTIPDKGHRALAGLSMGGAQALRIGLTHPETFEYIGAFSPAVGNLEPKTVYGGKLPAAAVLNKQFKLIWFGIGTEDGLHDGVKKSHENLDAAGIKNVWVETPGAHVWTVWRKYLVDFAPRLF